ncbi:MAG: rhomboid family intramembrane serine protease [Candidatus Njordarchaeales archaeon]
MMWRRRKGIIDALCFQFRIAPATFTIMLLCLIILILDYLTGRYILVRFGLFPYLLLKGVQIERLVTSIFLHKDFIHLFLNMWGLYVFGIPVERELGTRNFLIIYFLSGILGNILYSLMVVYVYRLPILTIVIGASGAISGILATFIVFYPRARLTVFVFIAIIPMTAIQFAIFYLVLQFLYMIAFGPSAGIAFFAHIVGFVVGWLLGKYYYRRIFIRRYVYPPGY